jgi:hypothetical protein
MPIYSWYDLSWQEQRTVLRLAREGRRHPDPRVAKVAEEWARERLGLDDRQAGAIGSIIFGALFGDGASMAEGIRDRRAAKRIMRVAARP